MWFNGPLKLIFKEALSTCSFPSEMKKKNIAPIHKKAISKSLKLTAQFHYFQYIGKYLKD